MLLEPPGPKGLELTLLFWTILRSGWNLQDRTGPNGITNRGLFLLEGKAVALAVTPHMDIPGRHTCAYGAVLV